MKTASVKFWENIFFNGNMSQVFGTLCCFSSRPFLKQLASHVSANTLQLKFRGMKFFLIHPRNWNIFWKVLKFFLHSVNERWVIAHKKIEKYDGKNVFLFMYFFNFFRNQLWQHLISYNSVRDMNMCFLEVAMCEKFRSSHF